MANKVASKASDKRKRRKLRQQHSQRTAAISENKSNPHPMTMPLAKTIVFHSPCQTRRPSTRTPTVTTSSGVTAISSSATRTARHPVHGFFRMFLTSSFIANSGRKKLGATLAAGPRQCWLWRRGNARPVRLNQFDKRLLLAPECQDHFRRRL